MDRHNEGFSDGMTASGWNRKTQPFSGLISDHISPLRGSYIDFFTDGDRPFYGQIHLLVHKFLFSSTEQ